MWDWISKIKEIQDKGRPFAIVTVSHVSGSTPREPGAKMIVEANGKFFGTIGGGLLELNALKDAQECLKEGVTKTLKYPLCIRTGQCCGGSVELLVEVVTQGPQVYLFGAGHVGQAVSRTLVGTPFTVHAVDEREEWIESEDLPTATVRHRESWQTFFESAKWDPQNTYVVVMTHLHDIDLEIIQNAIAKPARYIGLIGSQTKWARFQQKLRAAGFTDEQIARVTCPIGLPIGGKAPQEIAISFASEILKIHNGM